MMTYRVLKDVVLATALAFSTSLMQLPMVWASSSTPQNVDVEITVRVNEKGFLDQKGKVFGPQNILTLPHGKVVRMTFVFDEKMSSLAYGDTHQVAITGDGLTKESEKFWMFSQQASVIFQTGEEGAQYRAYCILDCIGMKHLTNLLINVV
jgi:hypothetical protein